MTDTAIPRLSVHTRPLDTPPAPPVRPSVVWRRGGDSLLGEGAAVRLTFTGPDRFLEADAALRALTALAVVRDEVGVPGSGLIAFGAFAFADASRATSVLIVPRRIVGERGGVAFETLVDGGAPVEESWTDGRAAGSGVTALDGAGYRAAVAEAVHRLRADQLEKVVLARDDLLATGADFDPADALTLLARRYPSAWTFAIDGFFGASPETLVAATNGTVTARVLAGTAARESDPGADAAARTALLNSMKDRFEHVLAVDSLAMVLAPRTRDLTIGRPFALELPNVWHIATDIEALPADGAGVLALVGALHPTAAVAGTPRERALAVIAELEPFDRGRYAGPVGWVGADGSGEWAIGLRSGQLETGGVRAFAGAGILAGSDPQSELRETGWKLAPMTEAVFSAATAPRADSPRVAAR